MQRPENLLVGNQVHQPPQPAETNPGRSPAWPETLSPISDPVGETEGQAMGEQYHQPGGVFNLGRANTTGNNEKPSLPQPKSYGHVQTEDAKFLRGIGRGAHVWTTYVKETKEYDSDMVDGWNRTLDVMLVFAALFSAILTGFVAESAKLLKPDASEQAVIILGQVLQVLQGSTSKQPFANSSDASDDTTFRPTRSAVWVNCLWYLSLSISVAVTLAAMLAKQWCYHYLSARSGDTITQAEERQKRYHGLTRWHMQGILEQLPMMMHISLALFSVGLVLYLWDINVTVAWVVTVVTLSALCFYLATTLIPVWVLFCPYKTAQSAYTKDMLNLLMTLPKAFVKILVKIWTGSTQAARRIQSQDFDPLNPVIWGRFFQAMLFRNPTQVPTNQENSAQATNQTRPGRLRSLVQVVNRWFSDRFSSLLNGTHQPDLESGPQHHLPAAGSDEEVEPDQFVKDALEWLIFNSQNSDSIDTAIGALAISKVPFDDRDLSDRINSHLVKHFSDCFSSSENGTKLQILPHQKAFKSALDYIDWMSYFAGGKIESISAQTATFIEILGGETVTNLGLAFASLAGHKNLHTAASRNVALWLASLIRCYDQGVLYLNEEVLSVYVDGLTVVGRGVRGSNASDRAQVLVVPNLINILWKVSHIDGSILRFSIALNLAAFALTTELPYPGSKRSFESAAGHLANYDYRSPSNQLTNFHSLVVFALLGFIHPRSNLGLNEEIVEISHKIIHETKYLEQSSSLSMSIPQLVELDPLRRHLTSMLIESMLPNAGTAFATRRYLFYTAFGDAIDVGQWENRTYKAVMPGVCQLIQDHLDGSLKLHDDAIVAATDLLLREVQELGGNLDFKIIIPNGPDEDESELPTRSLQGDIPAADDTERMPSVVLTRIMQESEHKKCVETAARAIMFHIHECRPELVMAATRWFATAFDVFGHVEAHVNDSRSQPQMCGYMRILAAMVIHCTDPTGLTNRLLGVNETNSDTRLHEAVENTCRLLTEAITDDTHLHAFSISSLTVWRFACLDETFSMDKIGQTLKEAWSLIAKHVECDLHTEALGALLDTIALLTAVTDPSIVISDTEARTLLRLLSQLRPETERLRPNLAVALAFCGLCLDASGWDFWTLNQRKESWRNYHRKPGTRTQDTSALLLLGLSRLLAHSQALMLDHTSIETITSEIDRYMQQHAKNPTKRLTLPFLPRFDVRRHVRESVWKYLQATESHAPFTKSMTASRVKLRTAVQYDGGEGFLYEAPQPFARTRSGMEF